MYIILIGRGLAALLILGEGQCERAADVNGDNRINVTDIMGIANIILKVPNASRAGNVEGLDPQ